MGQLFERLQRKMKAEAWIIDAARRHPRSRQLRSWIEKRRSARIVARAGSVDAALDAIVERAIAGSSTGDEEVTTPVVDIDRATSPAGPRRPTPSPIERQAGLRVGVLAPLPVSGIEGGNERQWRSLTTALNEEGYDAELVGIVSPEGNLAEVLDSYAMWHELDVSRFDVVISGKYPAFVVQHPCHVRHLSHPLRGLYEHYPADLPTALPHEFSAGLAACGDDIASVLQWAQRQASSRAGDPVMAFPGPFARAVVQHLDQLGRDEFIAEATMSETVANRPGYTDPNRPVSVFPPLTDLTGDGTEPSVAPSNKPFLFTFGRLDRAKRFDLVIDAFAIARRLPGMRDAELVIAGSGPLAEELAALAGDRVRLVGRLSDAEIAHHLQHAAAVVLTPVDEDYGLVAAEAMAAKTAVITTSDSGGVAEQLEHGRTGLVVHPKPALLAAAMRSLVVDRVRSDRMGRAAGDAVRGTTWQPFFDLIDEVATEAVRPRLVMVSTFTAEPVESGGQRRLRGMAAGLRQHGWDVVVLSLTNRVPPDATLRRRTSDGVQHVMVGRSAGHLAADFSMASILGSPVDDVTAASLWRATATFEAEVDRQLATADAMMLSHPFLIDAIPATEIPLIYDAFNVESDLKAAIFGDVDGGNWVAELAAVSEAAAIDRASLVSATTPDDLARFRQLRVMAPDAPGVVAVNPLTADLVEPRSDHERRRCRERFFLDLGQRDVGRPIALFLGSDHPPNRTAAQRCQALAVARPDLHVVIGGTVKSGDGPATILGSFAATDLRRIQAMADVVLNPIETGSGTSLKLIDPLSLGVPIVSTVRGARGLPEPADLVWLAEPSADAIGAAVDAAIADGAECRARLDAGRRVAQGARPAEAVRALAARLDSLVQRDANS